MWFFYALISAVFASIRKMNEKRFAQTMHYYTVGWTVQATALPALALVTSVTYQWLDLLALSRNFWLALLFICFVFYPLNTYCYVNAYKYGEFSKILPLQSLAPVFALLAGLVFGQIPAPLALVAMGFSVAGVYILNMKGRRLHNPVHMFSADKPNLLMLTNIGLATIASMVDVVGIRASNPLYFSFATTLGGALVLFSLGWVKKVREYDRIRHHIRGLSVAGTLFGLSFASSLVAIAHGPLAYVAAVRGTGMFMGAAIGIIWLHEKLTKQKVVAFTCMAIGLAFFTFA